MKGQVPNMGIYAPWWINAMNPYIKYSECMLGLYERVDFRLHILEIPPEVDNSYTLTNIIRNMEQNKEKTFAAFVDFAKAPNWVTIKFFYINYYKIMLMENVLSH